MTWFQHDIATLVPNTEDSVCSMTSEDIIFEGLSKIRKLYQEMNGPDKEPVSIKYDAYQDVLKCFSDVIVGS